MPATSSIEHKVGSFQADSIKGQKQGEHRAGFLRRLPAADPKRTFMPADNLQAHRQTQAGPALAFRCKERLEDPLPNLGMNAGARIRHRNG